MSENSQNLCPVRLFDCPSSFFIVPILVPVLGVSIEAFGRVFTQMLSIGTNTSISIIDFWLPVNTPSVKVGQSLTTLTVKHPYLCWWSYCFLLFFTKVYTFLSITIYLLYLKCVFIYICNGNVDFWHSVCISFLSSFTLMPAPAYYVITL